MATFRDFGISVSPNAMGNVKTVCPKCPPHKKRGSENDKDLSVDVTQGIWNCHRCGWSGSLKEKKQYVIPPHVDLPLSEKSIEWFKTRGINAVTLRKTGIYSQQEYMPQEKKEMSCICFPYFRDGVMVNVKYRDAKKNFKLVSGAELIFFELNRVSGKEEVMITEGEIDALSAIEAGYDNVCSVPNGANKGNAKLEYLNNCYEAFESAETIIIATDNDEAGVSLKNELIRRLGREKCYTVAYPDGCKDLNDVLVNHGSKGVWDVINAKQPLPVEGVHRVSDFSDELDEIYTNGFQEGIKLGYPEFDQYFKISPGRLTVITGIPNHGKSAFLDQMLIRIAARHQWGVALCSFENQPATIHLSNLMSCYVGRPFYRKSAADKMTFDEYMGAKSFLHEHFFLFKMKDEDLSVQGIIEKAKHLVKAEGIKALVVDPWNYIEHKRDKSLSETEYVSEALSIFSFFAKSYGVHIFLVAHPKKINKSKDTGYYEVPVLYDISGSAHFNNKCDNGITVFRNKDDIVTAYVQKIRFFMDGKRGHVDFVMQPETQRYKEVGEPEFISEYHKDLYETETPF